MNIPFDFIDFLGYESRPFKSKFIPRIIWDKLDEYQGDIESVAKLLKKYRIITKYEYSGEPLTVLLGEYDSNDDYIHILFTGDIFYCSPAEWDEFKFEFIQTILHEMIHQHQYAKRNGENIIHKVPYLDTPDEIQAHAHCAYLEMTTKNFMLTFGDLSKNPSASHTYLMYKDRQTFPQFAHWVNRWQRKYQKATIDYLNSK